MTDFKVRVLAFSDVDVKNPELALKLLRSKLENQNVQLIRADRIAGNEHLKVAASNVALATTQGRRKSKSPAMEMLLYTSGQAQITKAIETLGISRDTRALAAIIFTTLSAAFDERKVQETCIEVLGGFRDDSVIEVGTKEKREELCAAYAISNKELISASLPGEPRESTVKRLVVERSALVAID